MSVKTTSVPSQLKLEVFLRDETVSRKYRLFETKFHTVRVADTAVEKFVRVLGKKKNVSDEVRHNKMCRWLLSKAKITVPRLSGAEWEASVTTLFEKIFKEKYDLDFDKDGSEKSFVMPKGGEFVEV